MMNTVVKWLSVIAAIVSGFIHHYEAAIFYAVMALYWQREERNNIKVTLNLNRRGAL